MFIVSLIIVLSIICLIVGITLSLEVVSNLMDGFLSISLLICAIFFLAIGTYLLLISEDLYTKENKIICEVKYLKETIQ